MKIVSVECLGQSFVRHDIEVEDNNNFLAEEVVVHNSNARYVYLDGRMHCGSRTEWKREYPDYSHITEDGLVKQMLEADAKRAERLAGVVHPETGLSVYVPVTEEAARERARDVMRKLAGAAKRQNMWWQALDATPALRDFCEQHPGWVVYGEVYGAVQDLNYGHKKGEVSFAAFDILADGGWVDPHQRLSLLDEFGVPAVPVVADNFVFDFEKVCQMAEGKTLFPNANHVREGVVVEPLVPRTHERLGRVKLKWVGAGYLEKSKETEVAETVWGDVPIGEAA